MITIPNDSLWRSPHADVELGKSQSDAKPCSGSGRQRSVHVAGGQKWESHGEDFCRNMLRTSLVNVVVALGALWLIPGYKSESERELQVPGMLMVVLLLVLWDLWPFRVSSSSSRAQIPVAVSTDKRHGRCCLYPRKMSRLHRNTICFMVWNKFFFGYDDAPPALFFHLISSKWNSNWKRNIPSPLFVLENPFFTLLTTIQHTNHPPIGWV